MKRPTALVLVTLLFFAGIVVGVLGTHLYYARQFARPGGIASFALEIESRRLTRVLDLRPEQKDELDRILADVGVDIADVRRQMVLQLIEIRDHAATRFETVLDDDQRNTLEKLRQRQGRAFERYLE